MNEQLIVWTNEYEFGIEEIDNQHKKLVNILNELYSAFLTNQIDNSLILSIITELNKYTQYHFSTEEKIFKKVNFKDSDKHIEKHNKFITDIKKFKNSYLEKDSDLSLDLILFLKDWIIEHIQYEDAKYVDAFISNGY